jgi:hypothetical protein
MDAGFKKRANFPTLIEGLAGDQTRATCVARSGVNRLTIHYDRVRADEFTKRAKIRYFPHKKFKFRH